jgi:hypothetical protein
MNRRLRRPTRFVSSWLIVISLIAITIPALLFLAGNAVVFCDDEPWMRLTTQNPAPVITPPPDYVQRC